MKKAIALCLLCVCALITPLSACKDKVPAPTQIMPVESPDLNGMYLYWQQDSIQFPADENAKLSMYVNAEQDENGAFMFDDRQEWMLLMETSMGKYPLFERQPLQLGSLSCLVFNEDADGETIAHVLVTVRQTAGYRIYDCRFDSGKGAFMASPVYDFQGVNVIADSPK